MPEAQEIDNKIYWMSNVKPRFEMLYMPAYGKICRHMPAYGKIWIKLVYGGDLPRIAMRSYRRICLHMSSYVDIFYERDWPSLADSVRSVVTHRELPILLPRSFFCLYIPLTTPKCSPF